METLQFGKIELDEFEQLVSLYRDLQPDDPVVADGSDFSVFQSILTSEHFFLLGAKDSSGLVGSTYVNIIPNITRSASPYAVIENVVTKRMRQNSGIGKQLMRYTLDFIWTHGCYKVMLMTGSKADSVHAFYRSCGFDSASKFGYVIYPNSG